MRTQGPLHRSLHISPQFFCICTCVTSFTSHLVPLSSVSSQTSFDSLNLLQSIPSPSLSLPFPLYPFPPFLPLPSFIYRIIPFYHFPFSLPTPLFPSFPFFFPTSCFHPSLFRHHALFHLSFVIPISFPFRHINVNSMCHDFIVPVSFNFCACISKCS